MDLQGQKLSEHLMQILLVVFAIAAFTTGYMTGSFENMLLISVGGAVLTLLITVPDWSFFNRHPLNWLASQEAEQNPKPKLQPSPSKRFTKKTSSK
ncbi:hypothetical protein AMTRI_Chr02g211640 [Amborella trichopoda]|uniref:Signal peptidase complex subunit 1 n=1 Tax=Amborella trichopoda TaxID=13333 RepID=W1NX74_AMBTC|nr:probable signal peptidase complex subunit 1 [Amborella trichopoda]ERM99274.1 hypothetical protein AMTR_s00092p00156160 [Amborella trichopoda]|eukprot:XP_006836421.1 probable signal peptidase complex subunit 1 [Amborella trichopoda]